MVKYPYQGQAHDAIRDMLGDFDQTTLIELYHRILRIRLIEEEVANRYKDDHMKTPVHLVIGQEAVSVGCCYLLKNTDYVYCGHRTHGVYLAKGGDLKAMLSEFHCRANGCAGSRGGSMHLLDKEVGMLGSSALVGGAIPIATGFALSGSLLNQPRINAVFIGDAAVEEGACWESINFAVLKKLPMIYICENNYYSVMTPLEFRQPANTEIYKKAEAFGAQVDLIDGNNVLAVYKAMEKAIKHVEQNKQPVFIEARTYRHLGHHGDHDDTHLGHRSKVELEHWQDYDPLLMYQQVLLEQEILTNSEIDKMKATIGAEIVESFDFALNSPYPTAEDLQQRIYA